jgi:hypothetical protein
MKLNSHIEAPQLTKALAALVSVVLLAAAGPVYSAASADDRQLACQGTTSCGG